MSKHPLPTPSGLFSSRDTLEEALAYANELILSSVPVGAPRQAALTALHVTSNTAIKLLASYEPKEPSEENRGADMTFGENLYLLRSALPSIARIAFELRNVYPAASDVLGMATASLMIMTDTNLEEISERIIQGRK